MDIIKMQLLQIIKNKCCTRTCVNTNNAAMSADKLLYCPLAIATIESVDRRLDPMGITDIRLEVKVKCIHHGNRSVYEAATHMYIAKYGQDSLFEEML